MKRTLRAEDLLAENIRTLLSRRGIDHGALAAWCGHKPPWISKILKSSRGVQMKDLGKIADFFGLTVAQMFQHGISELAERRQGEQRSWDDRRTGRDRRQSPEGRLHPDVQARFPAKGHRNHDHNHGRHPLTKVK
jgi:hypothetical protein